MKAHSPLLIALLFLLTIICPHALAADTDDRVKLEVFIGQQSDAGIYRENLLLDPLPLEETQQQTQVPVLNFDAFPQALTKDIKAPEGERLLPNRILEAKILGVPKDENIPIAFSFSNPVFDGFIEYAEGQAPIFAFSDHRITCTGSFSLNAPVRIASFNGYPNYFAQVLSSNVARPKTPQNVFLVTGTWTDPRSKNSIVLSCVLSPASQTKLEQRQVFVNTVFHQQYALPTAFDVMMSPPDAEGEITVEFLWKGSELMGFTPKGSPRALLWEFGRDFSVNADHLKSGHIKKRFTIDVDGKEKRLLCAESTQTGGCANELNIKRPFRLEKFEDGSPVIPTDKDKETLNGRLVVTIEPYTTASITLPLQSALLSPTYPYATATLSIGGLVRTQADAALRLE